jgi:hypothetical protein
VPRSPENRLGLAFFGKWPDENLLWKGYFEDTPADSTNANRVQITPLEVARYLIQHPEYDPWYRQNVPALINWCKAVFGTDGSRGYNAQCEQLICYRPMGSHSARYASVCAMWHRQTGEKWFRDEAFENFNWLLTAPVTKELFRLEQVGREPGFPMDMAITSNIFWTEWRLSPRGRPKVRNTCWVLLRWFRKFITGNTKFHIKPICRVQPKPLRCSGNLKSFG